MDNEASGFAVCDRPPFAIPYVSTPPSTAASMIVSFLESGLTFVLTVSGKEAALLSSPPLGTARMTFAICRSSLSNALLGARFRHSQTKAVNLPVAYRM